MYDWPALICSTFFLFGLPLATELPPEFQGHRI